MMSLVMSSSLLVSVPHLPAIWWENPSCTEKWAPLYLRTTYTTLYKQINKWVTGYEHQSGGKGNSRIIPKQHEGKLNHWTCLQYGI